MNEKTLSKDARSGVKAKVISEYPHEGEWGEHVVLGVEADAEIFVHSRLDERQAEFELLRLKLHRRYALGMTQNVQESTSFSDFQIVTNVVETWQLTSMEVYEHG